MDERETTCGEEIAADAEVPERLSALMGHVAGNMVAHARWVGAGGGGQREHDGLMAVAREYEAIAAAAGRAAAAMRDVPAAPHDPARRDGAGLALWMRAKIVMQVELAEMLMRHADASRTALAEMEGGRAGH